MASRSTINPSSWRTPIPDLRAQYRQIVYREALSAVEERDPVLRREIEALRFKCRSLDSELCDMNRCLEVESAMVKRMQENERWLRQSKWELEEERRELNLIIDDMKKEISEFESKKNGEIDRVSELPLMNKVLQTQKSELEVEVRKLENAKKANEVWRVNKKKLVVVEAQKTEFSLRIQVLEKEKKSETERIMNEKTKLETENRRLEEEVKKKMLG